MATTTVHAGHRYGHLVCLGVIGTQPILFREQFDCHLRSRGLPRIDNFNLPDVSHGCGEHVSYGLRARLPGVCVYVLSVCPTNCRCVLSPQRRLRLLGTNNLFGRSVPSLH